jgi:ATP-dependent HslUV protease subunit HslV
MSTIAYRAGVMAADTAVTAGGDRYCGTIRKIERIGGCLIGCCGCVESNELFFRWWREGCRADRRPSLREGFAAIVVSPDGTVTCWGDKLVPMRIDADFHADGSGADFAIGAMAAGATAEQAVMIACHFDTCSRAPVEVLRLSEDTHA